MQDTHSLDFNLFRALEVFAAIAETQSVTAAAKTVKLTQSAASQHLKSLETAFGVALIDRSTRPIRITPAGAALHRRALIVLGEVDKLKAHVRRESPFPFESINVAILASIATTLTPALNQLFRKQLGVKELILHAGILSDHFEQLSSKRSDLAITASAFYELEGLERQPLLTESFLLVLPETYDGPTDDLGEVARRLPFVQFSGTTFVGRQTEMHFRRLRIVPDRVIQADRSSLVTSSVHAGVGFSVLTPTLLIDGLVENMKLRICPLPGPGFTRTLNVITREGELGDFPSRLAATCRDVLTSKIAGLMGPLGESAVRFDRGDPQ